MHHRFVVLCLIAGLAGTAAAAPPPGGPFGPPPGHGRPGPPDPVLGAAGRALHLLDLSPEQRHEIHGLIERALDGEVGEHARAFVAARHALEVLIWDPGTADAAIIEAAALAADRARPLELARHRLALDVAAILSDEQRAAFRLLLAEPPHPPERPGPRGR
jgi:Spy/CpxP family protein refolding chaperone